MAAAEPERTLQEEVSCSICLHYFKDPVATDCGHNFCRNCITRHWEGLGTNITCPECQEKCVRETLRTNRHLANIVENVKQLQITQGVSHEEEEEDLCKEHEEKLTLFCREDRLPICVVCSRSIQHQEHIVVPIEEATLECKDVKNKWNRYRNVSTYSPKQERNLKSFLQQPSILKKSILEFKDEITFDPETAHPRLIVSTDGKCVKHGACAQGLPDTNERYDTHPMVLGSERISSGRHYWEVEVGCKTQWILGVCDESSTRKGEIQPTPQGGYWTIWFKDNQYRACTSQYILLTLCVFPRSVGVFLDYQAGLVSFYNVDGRSLLFSFHQASLPRTLRPFFYTGSNGGGKNVGALRILPVRTEEQHQEGVWTSLL
ncbi:E3 ubiquitin-protein ligase TRIM39-like isoform X2 [Ambystoma mexicanum]|uniref:E3 ubiquitin-protein ligase TRIM39-like isoform X2 n=1 Tax=Ambystoma mexicanum TaxID=8296 RepID=UPI0037E855D7